MAPQQVKKMQQNSNETPAQNTFKALAVLLHNESVVAVLKAQDPMALLQAYTALASAEPENPLWAKGIATANDTLATARQGKFARHVLVPTEDEDEEVKVLDATDYTRALEEALQSKGYEVQETTQAVADRLQEREFLLESGDLDDGNSLSELKSDERLRELSQWGHPVPGF